MLVVGFATLFMVIHFYYLAGPSVINVWYLSFHIHSKTGWFSRSLLKYLGNTLYADLAYITYIKARDHDAFRFVYFFLIFLGWENQKHSQSPVAKEFHDLNLSLLSSTLKTVKKIFLTRSILLIQSFINIKIPHDPFLTFDTIFSGYYILTIRTILRIFKTTTLVE